MTNIWGGGVFHLLYLRIGTSLNTTTVRMDTGE